MNASSGRASRGRSRKRVIVKVKQHCLIALELRLLLLLSHLLLTTENLGHLLLERATILFGCCTDSTVRLEVGIDELVGRGLQRLLGRFRVSLGWRGWRFRVLSRWWSTHLWRTSLCMSFQLGVLLPCFNIERDVLLLHVISCSNNRLCLLEWIARTLLMMMFRRWLSGHQRIFFVLGWSGRSRGLGIHLHLGAISACILSWSTLLLHKSYVVLRSGCMRRHLILTRQLL